MESKDFKTKSETISREFRCPEGHWVVGLDIGYSGVKVMSPNKVACFPAYARSVPKDRTTFRESSPTDIRYRDDEIGDWVVGNLAYDEVVSSEVVDSEAELYGRNRYYSDIFKVIARTGIALALIGNGYGNATGKKVTIQTGLPPKYLKEDQKYLKEVLAGRHQFMISIGGEPYRKFDYVLTENDIHVMPQPLGALVSSTVGYDGKMLPDANKYFRSNLVIFDPGFGTVDDYVVNKGNVVGVNTYPNLGMREVFARTCEKISAVYGVELEIPELQNYLETGEIRIMDKKLMKRSVKSFRTQLEESCKEVCEEAIKKMLAVHNYFEGCDYIIAAGGTYDAWAVQFNEFFKNMDDLRIIPGNVNDTSLSNIYSNVRGYYYQCVGRIKK